MGCVDGYERRIQSSAHMKHVYVLKCTLSPLLYGRVQIVWMCTPLLRVAAHQLVATIHSLDFADTGNLTDGYAVALRRRWNNHSTYKNFKISTLSALSIYCISVQHRQRSDV